MGIKEFIHFIVTYCTLGIVLQDKTRTSLRFGDKTLALSAQNFLINVDCVGIVMTKKIKGQNKHRCNLI